MERSDLYYGGTGELLIYSGFLAIVAGACLFLGLLGVYLSRHSMRGTIKTTCRYLTCFGGVLLFISVIYFFTALVIPVGPVLCAIADSIGVPLVPLLVSILGAIFLVRRWAAITRETSS